jgi:hypothetical protein
MKFTDHGVSCDEPGCLACLWGSQMGLRGGMTLRYVRKMASERGWKTGVRLPPLKMDDRVPRYGDFCPAHASAAPSGT